MKIDTEVREKEKTKICYMCREEKKLSEFYHRCDTKDGHGTLCKECQKEYYKNNKDIISKKSKIYRNANKPRLANIAKAYRLRNPDNVRESKRLFWKNNRERILKQRKGEYKDNILHILQQHAATRAKIKNLPYEKDFLVNKYTEIPKECEVLHIPIICNAGNGTHSANSPSVDRIDSSKGYTTDNVRIISHRANTLKSNATSEELRLVFEDSLRLQRNSQTNSEVPERNNP